MKKKILFVFGTRPEAVKMAPILHALESHRDSLNPLVCVTAQHREMLDDVLQLFNIRPAYDLNIMKDEQSLEHITKKVIDRLTPILKKEKPDLVLVQGDTSTAFLSTLASFYLKIPVGHVEAGLRTHNDLHPFPEEANRRLTDSLSALCFAPTLSAKKNLLKENIPEKRIFLTGNTVIDALKWAVSKVHPFKNEKLKDFFCFRRGAENRRLILVTAHRRENFGKPLMEICRAVRRVADAFPDVEIIYPAHPNPNVQKAVKKILIRHPRILILPPLNYLDFAQVIKSSYLVVTDSGGLQEEAPSLGKPVLVLRSRTERPEAVIAGTTKVIGTKKEKIVSEISKLLRNESLYSKMARASNPYGDGRASERTISAILHYFKNLPA